MILTSGFSYRSCWITQKSQKCLFGCSKEPKMRFLAIFLSYVHRIDLKLHILILLNDHDLWAVISPVLNHSKITKLPFWIIQIEPKMGFYTNFWSLVNQIDLIFDILIVLNDFDTWAVISPMLDHSKITKIPFWVIQRAKNDVFDHFLEFGLLVRLDIAYYETTTCLTTLIVTRSRIIIQKPRKCIFDQSKGSKKGFCQFQGLWSVGSSSN